MPRLKGRHSEWLGPLGQRLAAGSVAIALGSIVLLGGLTLLLADSDLTSAGHEREAASTKAIVNSVRSTYLADPDWQPIDLASAEDLVRAIGVGVELRANGRLLMQVAPPAAGGSSRTVPVVASGRTVATAIITFPSSGVLPEEIAFRRSIEKSVALAAGLALLVALGAAVLGSRRLVAPLRSLTLATRQLAAGDRASRVGGLRASGELAELATAFDGMADKLEREDALRRALVADLAHELRTPLAVLQAQLEGLAVGLLSLDQTAVASLAEEVGQLSRLIEDLRVLSAAEAAGLSLRSERVDLARVVSNATARLTPRFVEKEVDLSVKLAAAEVDGDPGRLEQVVVNLLSNAAKFTPPGGKVKISVDAEGDHRRIVVADTGRGIPPQEQDLVFDRFFRGTASHDTPGSGIGLAVVAALVAAHGGSVKVESTVESGSTFMVNFPKA